MTHPVADARVDADLFDLPSLDPVSSEPRPLGASRVLVTGGAGFIGSHLVDELITRQVKSIAVIDDLSLGRRENLAEAFEARPDLALEVGDAADFRFLESVITRLGIDVVFDLATRPLPYSLEHPHTTVMMNVAMLTNLAELARFGVIDTIVHFSSSEIYGTAQSVPMTEQHPIVPLTPYAASKAAADLVLSTYIETFGIDACTVRPFNNYGPRQNDAAYAGVIPIAVERALLREPMPIHGDGEQTRDFIYVGDTARAAADAYEHPATRGQIINLGSGTEISVNELVAAIYEAAGTPLRVEHGPARPADVRRHCSSSVLASELIGFGPSVGIDRGLARTVEWYRSRLRVAL